MERFIAGIIFFVGMFIVGICIWWQSSADVKAHRASDELPKLKEMLDKQQKQIDDLRRELEELKRQ